jgi:hypothetical protein
MASLLKLLGLDFAGIGLGVAVGKVKPRFYVRLPYELTINP